MRSDRLSISLPTGGLVVDTTTPIGATVGDLVAAYIARESGALRRLAPRTLELRIQQLRAHILPLIGEKTLATSVSAVEIRTVVDGLSERGLSGSTIRSCIGALAAVYRQAVRAGVVAHNPVRDLERGELPTPARLSDPRYLSRGEVERLLQELSPQFRPVAATLFYAGLRVSEALSLRWRDLDPDGGVIRVPGTKSAASRASVPLLQPLAEELDAHRQRLLQRGGGDAVAGWQLVFQTESGRSPGRRNVHRAISNSAVKAGLVGPGADPVGPHDLRHSLAALGFDAGLSVVEVSRLLRHANPAVTLRVYAGLTDVAAARLGAKLGDALAAACDRECAAGG